MTRAMPKIFEKHNFQLYAIPARKFWKEYSKTKYKYNDESGEFGYENYSYFYYKGKDGYCILIGTKERIWSLRQRKFLEEILDRVNIDINEALEDGKVIIAMVKEPETNG